MLFIVLSKLGNLSRYKTMGLLVMLFIVLSKPLYRPFELLNRLLVMLFIVLSKLSKIWRFKRLVC